jgi:glycosyltransferase involved in cell wall biosynthesis
MAERALHQFTEGAYIGDAVSDQVFAIQRWLRELGFASEVYSERIQPELAGRVRPVREYRPGAGESCLIHHHAVGSDIAERLMALDVPQLLIYHNITPPQFYAFTDPILAAHLQKGRRQLEAMRPNTILGLGDSGYNARELAELGYERTGVLPIVLDEAHFRAPLNEALAAEYVAARPLVLFVGRFAPNKRQEDLLKLHHCLRRILPTARLALVGNTDNTDYVAWLRGLAGDLGLDEDALRITGHVTHQDMITYYRRADVYVSMSEHEGFGKPLIESMYCGLPVVAYASTAVPDTLGDAGILFHRKDFEGLAELIATLLADDPLRRRVIARQTGRVRSFLEPQVRRQWEAHLRSVGLLPDGEGR